MARDFDYEILTFTQRESIHNALAETTAKHILASEGLFTRSDFNPTLPSHQLETVHLGTAATTRERIDERALIAGPDLYPAIQETLTKQAAVISAARLLLRREHVFVVTGPHVNIADVAVFSAGWSAHLEHEDWQERNGLTVSRGVATIEAFGTPGAQVVQEIGHVFMSFPRTKTIEKLTVSDEHLSPDQISSLIDTNNHRMRAAARSWLGVDMKHLLSRSGGNTLHQSWEGKTTPIEYGDDGHPKRIALQKVHSGIIDVLKHGLVLPVTLLGGQDPIVEFGEFTRVHSQQDIQRIQAWQRETLMQRLGLPADSVTIDH